jgi:hypothetical protein
MTRRAWVLLVTLVVLAGASAVIGGVYRERRLEARSLPAYAPMATIKDLMESIVDPSADVVWDSVATTVGAGGIDERAPRTDQEWTEVRKGAIRLVEAANLLMMPGRHVARPDEKSETPGVELEPAEMEALITKDREAWEKRVQALRVVSLEALQAIDAKDTNRLFDVGDRIDTACENCHRLYWYPNEKIPDFPSESSSLSKTKTTD